MLDILKIAPATAELLLELSYLESRVDDYRAARGWALRAARIGPASLDDAITLVRRLRTFNESRLLDGFARGLLGNSRANPILLAECAAHLSNLNLPAIALRCADAAVAAAPGSTQARLLRGQHQGGFGGVAQPVGIAVAGGVAVAFAGVVAVAVAAGVRSSVYYDATMRHLMAWWEGEDTDPDSGMSHITKAITSLVVLRDAMIQDMCTDDRPPRSAEFYARLNTLAAEVLARHADKSPRHYTIADSK